MATGPEHYSLAEAAIENAKSYDFGSGKERFYLDIAHVHATLAVAAATAMGGAGAGMSPIDLEAWDKVCGVQEADEDEPCTRCWDYGHEAGDCKVILDDADDAGLAAPVGTTEADR